MSVSIFPQARPITADVEALWAAYVEAARKAQASQRLEDGIVAGRAWAAFMRAFE